MSFNEQWNAFREVNERRRWKPATLKASDKEGWRILRRGIEEAMKQPLLASSPLADSRDHLRVPASLTTQYRMNGRWVTSPLINLGEGGCFIATPECLDLGCPILLDISSEYALLTSIRAEVVWIRRPGEEGQAGMAVRFRQLEMTQRTMLYSIIDRILYHFAIQEGSPRPMR